MGPKKRKEEHSNSTVELSSLEYFQGDHGALVWGKVKGSPWWPGLVINGNDCGLSQAPSTFTWVFWLEDRRVSKVPRNWVGDFTEHFNSLNRTCKQENCRNAVIQAIKIYANRVGINTETWTNRRILSWAENGFTVTTKIRDIPSTLPAEVIQRLNKIKSRNIASEKKSARSLSEERGRKKFTSRVCSSASSSQVKANSDLDKVKRGELGIEEICIGCKTKQDGSVEHPYFLGTLCNDCGDNIREGIFSFGEDGIHTHCAICGCTGEVFICSNEECCKVYCYQCIQLLASSNAMEIIKRKDPWNCFLCETSKISLNGFISPRSKSEICEKITLLFSTGRKCNIPQKKSKDGVRVLSLFDGIGTGMVVLKKLGIKVQKYFACEIDQNAMNVSTFNHGSNITQIGDITKLTEDKISALGNIDLLIGGSPCTELSLVNPARKGIFNTDGSGCLFFDFYRVLSILKKNTPVFWLFENTAAMPKSTREIITRFLECDPVIIDACWLSAQHRARFFWGNIPGLSHTMITDLNINLDQCLESKFNRQALVKKIRTVTTSANSHKQGKHGHAVKVDGEKQDNLMITELETVFGFPLHYTDSGNINLNRRRQLLGKSWSVPVIEHILRPLKLYFSCEEKSGPSSKRKRY